MSLKAKIEAVIYASEEPVTLTQLVGLLGQEAQRELDAIAALQINLIHPTTLHVAAPGREPEPELALVDLIEQIDQIDQIPDQPAEQAEAEAPAAAVEPEAPETAAQKRAARERERKLREYLREIIDQLVRDYSTSDRGLEVREVAGGYRMATKPEYHDAVRGFVKSLKPPLKLTLQALETLAVVAYKQPVTAPEIAEIRGVDSGGVLGSLMARKLITTAGRKQVIGRPILYKTTKDFLVRFGLKDVSELPSIEEFEKMAGELAEQEEISMPEHHESPQEVTNETITHENLLEEAHVSQPQADGDTSSLDASESERPVDELPALDGRLSGLPPRYDAPGEDPSADEAALQSSESEGF